MFKFCLKRSKKYDLIKSDPKKLDDLPEIVYKSLFKNLSINDLFNCRLINKNFYEHVNQYNNIYKLVIGENNVEDDLWLNNKESIEEEYVISLKTYRRIKSIPLFNLNESLKYLIINLVDGFAFEELFNLINLEYLEIRNSAINREEYLNFKNLKILVIKNNINQFGYLLNTPKIEKIKIDGICNISFTSSPDTLKHIIIERLEIEKINIIKNLEIIELNQLYEPLDQSILEIFKNLKFIRLNINDPSTLSDARILSDLIGVFRKKSKLERQIGIYLSGVEIVYEAQFNEFKSYKNALEYQIKNYYLLSSDLFFMTKLNYNDLKNLFKNIENDLPKSFFYKYSNLSNVIVNFEAQNDINTNDLIWFFKNSKGIKNLELLNLTSLDENIFNGLPATIRKLSIGYKKNVDSNFHLFINDFTCRLFLKLKYLKSFRLQLNRSNFLEIIKNNNNTFDSINKLDYSSSKHIEKKGLDLLRSYRNVSNNEQENTNHRTPNFFRNLSALKVLDFILILNEAILSFILSRYVTSSDNYLEFKNICFGVFLISLFLLISKFIVNYCFKSFKSTFESLRFWICLLAFLLFLIDGITLIFYLVITCVFGLIFSGIFFIHLVVLYKKFEKREKIRKINI